MISVDSIKVADSLKFTTPKGKVVYGGGGIIPDVFVPIGTNEEEAVESMDNLGWLSYFIFEHLDGNRKQYSDYSKQDFMENFRADDILFEEFVDYSIQRNLKMDFYDYEDSFKTYLKAALAEQLFGANLHAQIKGSEDPMLQEVLELDNPAIKRGEAEAIEANN
jgi:carboxyl-terminal processing protease